MQRKRKPSIRHLSKSRSRSDSKIVEAARKVLAEAKIARRLLTKERAIYLGASRGGDAGDYYINFGKTIKNRILDLYDDCNILISQGRFPSACVLARCIVETYALGLYFSDSVENALKRGGIDVARDEILRFINSSCFKVSSQKKLKNGVFSLGDYTFTEVYRQEGLFSVL
jgi:hypothetical protein